MNESSKMFVIVIDYMMIQKVNQTNIYRDIRDKTPNPYKIRILSIRKWYWEHRLDQKKESDRVFLTSWESKLNAHVIMLLLSKYIASTQTYKWRICLSY